MISRKFTKKFDSKVINRQYFDRKTGLELPCHISCSSLLRVYFILMQLLFLFAQVLVVKLLLLLLPNYTNVGLTKLFKRGLLSMAGFIHTYMCIKGVTFPFKHRTQYTL